MHTEWMVWTCKYRTLSSCECICVALGFPSECDSELEEYGEGNDMMFGV